MKEKLKHLARAIREDKSKRKSVPNGYILDLISNQWHYRHMHIAYCLMRGTPMKMIEPKNRLDNEPDMDLVKSYMEVVDEEQTTSLAS